MAAMINNSGAGKFSSIEDEDKTKIYQLINHSDTDLRALITNDEDKLFNTLFCVVKDGWALEFASEELQGDREVVLAAVRQNGLALQHASAELKMDRELVLAAVKRYGCALEYASEALRGDPGIIAAAAQ